MLIEESAMKYFRINSGESMENTNYDTDKAYSNWRKWMEFGQKCGCHQRADRSFFLRGYQMPYCARCTGVLIGYLIAIPMFFLVGFSKLASITGGAILFIDWFLQETGFKKSTNKRRLITGIAGGFGIMSFHLFLIKKAIRFFSRIHK
jgi:uncharacterized membrane protein